MYSESAQYYDEIYTSFKDYAAEVDKVHQIIQEHKQSPGNRLLDVACGTGIHTGLLAERYQVEGLDLDARMLSVAKKKYPKIRFHQGDMTDFDLGRKFDVVVCLFSSIGYVKMRSRLRKAIKNMGRHLLPGGLLLIEPWFTPEQWNPGRISTIHVKNSERQVVRMSRSAQKGQISFTEFQYLIGTSKGIEHRVEMHELGLFTHQEYMDAFQPARLHVLHDAEGLDGRGLYIGTKNEKQQ